ncbi:ATP-binding protein [Blastococcus sp. URHD0036]|uniref:ATP-binding protein n=1 Tax=Blastococcus sp. URHD0036 TaxID=1380356 RepID=UPI000689A651|nr:ATP-binding protein [Blastococcus sp. URHD0036]
MDIAFTVTLPVDTGSVPFVRGLCRQALEHLRVPPSVVDEVALALTEACANVVQHSGGDARYEVGVAIDDDRCRITVWDDGEGLDPRAAPNTATGRELAEGGTGLLLMKALVDRLDFRHDPDGRHRVTLVKQLGSRPALRLLD